MILQRHLLRRAIAFLLGVYSLPACSVLTHEAVVDALWDVQMKPMLQAQYPQTTPDQMNTAHGYAYGGSIVQDLGYYPRGSKQFSDLAHYVRTGQFIKALIAESHDVNELAFAYGALSHYVSDVDVHSRATNVGEPMLYPELRRKYGPVVTYEQDPAAHLKTEFGFDVLEVARGNFAPQAYRDFIGFYIASGVLDRAIQDTFDLQAKELFPDFDRVIGTYRRDVSRLIPKATRIAWAQRRDEIQKAQPGITYRRFVYIMKRSSYERAWGKQYDVPSAWERVLAVLLKLIPPVGPLRSLKFRMPTPPVEKLFMASFDRAVQQSKDDLSAVRSQTLQLEDLNYDVGKRTGPGQYGLQDKSYARWLHLLAQKQFAGLTPEIKAQFVAYYAHPDALIDTKRHRKHWAEVQEDLAALKAAPVGPSQRLGRLWHADNSPGE